MPLWGWILIALVAVLVVSVAAGMLLMQRRTARLKERFGPEYDRTVRDSSSRRAAESELAGRESRRRQLEIRPLSPQARDRYAARWQSLQAEFVDAPTQAVAEADMLVIQVMRDRGYPMDDFDQRAADVSVDHPEIVESYREAHRISELSANDDASTEDERQALRRYRQLFDALLAPSEDEPTMRERGEATDDAALSGRRRR
jgi:hypothetical protein